MNPVTYMEFLSWLIKDCMLFFFKFPSVLGLFGVFLFVCFSAKYYLHVNSMTWQELISIISEFAAAANW